MNAILGKKLRQTQVFLTDGTRMAATVVETKPNIVTDIKTIEKNGYWSVQLGIGAKKRATKAELGHAMKGAKLDKAPSFLKEIRYANMPEVELGSSIEAATVLELGDIIDVTGISKGKGFAGGVKRWHFRGGPRTHGQSDRERAPGSIGAGTTPGRVYKNKHMAGKMGNDTVTIQNLIVLSVNGDEVLVSGVVPGKLGTVVTLKATGKKVKKTPELVGVVKEEEVVEAPVIEETVEESLISDSPVGEEKSPEDLSDAPRDDNQESVEATPATEEVENKEESNG